MGQGPRGPCLLLLPLIGAALAQAASSTPAKVGGPAEVAPAPAAPAWRLVDQRTPGVCLHMYLERDFPRIERIIYPARANRSGASGKGRFDYDGAVAVDGPSMKADCQQMTRLVNCLTDSLGRMQYYENFHEFRPLVVALDSVLLELCGTVDLMRYRFIPLLQSLNCIEQVRAERSSCPYRDRLPRNIWHQLIRLEADSTLCWPLTRQLNCVGEEGKIRQHCGEPAQHLFTNISSVFLKHWCLNTGSSLSQTHFILKALVVLLSFLPLSSFFTNIQ